MRKVIRIVGPRREYPRTFPADMVGMKLEVDAADILNNGDVYTECNGTYNLFYKGEYEVEKIDNKYAVEKEIVLWASGGKLVQWTIHPYSEDEHAVIVKCNRPRKTYFVYRNTTGEFVWRDTVRETEVRNPKDVPHYVNYAARRIVKRGNRMKVGVYNCPTTGKRRAAVRIFTDKTMTVLETTFDIDGDVFVFESINQVDLALGGAWIHGIAVPVLK